MLQATESKSAPKAEAGPDNARRSFNLCRKGGRRRPAELPRSEPGQ
jgi:hypothetical protein